MSRDVFVKWHARQAGRNGIGIGPLTHELDTATHTIDQSIARHALQIAAQCCGRCVQLFFELTKRDEAALLEQIHDCPLALSRMHPCSLRCSFAAVWCS